MGRAVRQPRVSCSAIALATVAAVAGEECALKELRLWGGDDALRLQPGYAQAIHSYDASLDFDGGPLWVEPITSGGCDARRADAGRRIQPGRSGTILVHTNADEPEEYTVNVTRHSGRETFLRGLVMPGAKLLPSFRPDVTQYGVSLDGLYGDRVWLSCGLFDAGQLVELVSIRPTVLTELPPVDPRLASSNSGQASLSMPSGGPWKNFSLGNLVKGGTQLRDSDGNFRPLPVQVSLRIWPADNSVSVEAGTYTVMLKPSGEKWFSVDSLKNPTSTAAASWTPASSTTKPSASQTTLKSGASRLGNSASTIGPTSTASTAATYSTGGATQLATQSQQPMVQLTTTSSLAGVAVLATGSKQPIDSAEPRLRSRGRPSNGKAFVMAIATVTFVTALLAVAVLHPPAGCQVAGQSQARLIGTDVSEVENDTTLLRAAVLIST